METEPEAHLSQKQKHDIIIWEGRAQVRELAETGLCGVGAGSGDANAA